MKSFLSIFAAVLFSVATLAAVDVRRPIPEVTLKDGKVLKNVVIVSFTTNAVMAKWDGGRGTIRHEQMPADLLAAMPQAKTEVTAPAGLSPVPVSGPTRKITGQVFEKDDRGGAFKFVDIEIKAYPLDNFAEVKKAQISAYGRTTVPDDPMLMRNSFTSALRSLRPVAVSRTDAEGKFVLEVPEGQQVFLHARGVFNWRTGSILRMWAVEAKGDIVNLSGENQWEQWRVSPP